MLISEAEIEAALDAYLGSKLWRTSAGVPGYRDAMRAALSAASVAREAAPPIEPVAWRYRDAWGKWTYCQAIDNINGPTVITEKQSLYAAPFSAAREPSPLSKAWRDRACVYATAVDETALPYEARVVLRQCADELDATREASGLVLALLRAMAAVEQSDGSPAMIDAITLLAKARGRVADHVEGNRAEGMCCARRIYGSQAAAAIRKAAYDRAKVSLPAPPAGDIK